MIKSKLQSKWFRIIIREPLVHFFLLGTLIFILFDLVGSSKPEPADKVINISSSMVENMINRWMLRMNRLPTQTELQTMVDKYIDEEILFREALLLELDEDDVVIRQRLAQKMEFISRQVLTVQKPNPAEIRSYFESVQDKYRIDGRVSFTHIYFNTDKRTEQDAERAAMQIMKELNSRNILPEETSEMGDRFLMGYEHRMVPGKDIARQYGSSSFVDSLYVYSPGIWEGPLKSSFGIHLVLVHEREDARYPEFEEVADRVRQDYIDLKTMELDEAFRLQLRSRYKIRFDENLIDEYSEDTEKDTIP